MIPNTNTTFCNCPKETPKVGFDVINNDDAIHVLRGYENVYDLHNEDFRGSRAGFPS